MGFIRIWEVRIELVQFPVNSRKKMKRKNYLTPKVKAVKFSVERGYDLSADTNRPSAGTTFQFGGNVPRGYINPDGSNGSYDDHSGLNQYGDGGNIFGE